jgi:hypothetical protein
MLKNTFYSADRKVRFEPSGQTLYYGRIRCTTIRPSAKMPMTARPTAAPNCSCLCKQVVLTSRRSTCTANKKF